MATEDWPNHMRALVTGITGLLGRHLACELIRQGWSVAGVVRPSSNRNSIQSLPIEFHVCDLSCESPLPEAFRGADAVFHTAAAVTDWASWPFFLANTVQAAQRICDGALAAGCGRLVFVSSVAVYGRPPTGNLINEQFPYRSIGRWDYYTHSKILAERLVWRCAQERGLKATIIRPAMIYGSGDRTLLGRLISLLRQGKVFFAGEPRTPLPLVHVRDVVRAALLAATSPCALGEAFNVVNPEEVTQEQFFNTIAALIGAPAVRRRLPYRLAYAAGFAAEIVAHALNVKQAPSLTRYRVSLLGHERRYSIGKIQRLLGWQPCIAFGDGIQETVRDQLQPECRTSRN